MVAIEDVDAFRVWLIKKLGPVCDADPSALAKYVVALVKKDKPENDLKVLCKEQLDVFLQKETDEFVKGLFEALQTKSYLPTPKEPDSKVEDKTVSQDQKEKAKETQRSHSTTSRSPVRRPRSPEMRRRYDDRRHRRRSPVQDSRRHYGRRPRSKSLSPHRRGRSSMSPGSRRRNPRSRSPRRSRSPLKRKRSNSPKSHSSSSDRSSSTDSPSRSRPNPQTGEKRKERCWDYDQKGFCMKGDLCPFDHGTDALVVDDLTITTAASRPEEGKGGDTEPVLDVRPPQPPAILPPRPLVQGLPLGMPFPPPPVMPPMSVPPPLLHRFPIPINVNVPPPQIHPPPIGNFRKRPTGNGNTTEPGAKRPHYNNNAGSFNKTLIVKKIPAILNNITKLNEHFAKFGAINNIQVKYNSQPNQALIEYAHVNSARAAIKDAEAVLNNRFIRVFWHNNEEAQQANPVAEPNKVQANVKDRIGCLPKADPVKVAATDDDDKKATFADGVISRTISNTQKAEEVQTLSKEEEDAAALKLAMEKKAAIEASNEAKKKIAEAREAVRLKTVEKQRLVLQKKVELQKQRQGLMQKQMEQQKLLLAKLDASKDLPASEKTELMKTLKALTSTIDSIRNLHKSTSQRKVNQEKQKQAQKDMLDTELDIYNASTNGENTITLKRKLNLLKSEASSLGIVPAYRGGWGGRGRGRGKSRGRGSSHRFIKSGANLDRRPCEIRVSGFQESEKDEMISHFADFGEFEKCSFDDEGITCTIKYKARHDAEQAASQGMTFKGKNLIIVWSSPHSKPPVPTTSVPSPVSIPKVVHSPITILAPPKNEEEEDDEDISVVVEPVVAYTPLEDDFGYGLLEEELDEEALLTGGDLDEEEEANGDEERSWKH